MQKIFIIKTLKSPYDSPLEGEIKRSFINIFTFLSFPNLLEIQISLREKLYSEIKC